MGSFQTWNLGFGEGKKKKKNWVSSACEVKGEEGEREKGEE